MPVASPRRTSSWRRRWSGWPRAGRIRSATTRQPAPASGPRSNDGPEVGGSSRKQDRMAFFQQPPRLDNPFDGDAMLASWIARFCPEVAAELRALGELSVEFYGKQLADRRNEP